MAKTSSVQKNLKRIKLSDRARNKREKLKDIIYDKNLPLEERFMASLTLAKMPRNSSRTRVRNRCLETGRPRGYYRKFKLSRIMLRKLASEKLLPGIRKSSW